MKKYALIGQNIEYSYSPFVHNLITAEAGFESEYTLMSFDAVSLPAFVDRLKGGYDGFNVTKPFKQDIIPYLYTNNSQTGAVNTVDINAGILTGYNTDGTGFLHSLKFNNLDFYGKDVLLLGAGGAARAIAYELDKTCNVSIYNRTTDKVKIIIKELNLKNTNIADITSIKPHVIVNATTLGLKDEMSLPEGLNIDKLEIVYDTIYNPHMTPLLKWAKGCNKVYVNGLSMLLFQALEAQKIWQGITLSEKKIREIYKQLEAKI